MGVEYFEYSQSSKLLNMKQKNGYTIWGAEEIGKIFRSPQKVAE